MQSISGNIYLFFHILHGELGRSWLVSKDHSSERNAFENTDSTEFSCKKCDHSLVLPVEARKSNATKLIVCIRLDL